MKLKQKIILGILATMAISISIIAPLQQSAQAALNFDQGTGGGYLGWGPRKYPCGYTAINVGVTSSDAWIMIKNPGGLVDIRSNLLELDIGIATTLSSAYADLEDLVSIDVNIAVYDHTLQRFHPRTSVFARSYLTHDNAHVHEYGTYVANVWKAASFVAGRINPVFGYTMSAIGYFRSEGGISLTYSTNGRTGCWQAGAGPPFYVEHWDHKEIRWEGTIGSLDVSNNHCYQVLIKVVVRHSGNMGYGSDIITYDFFLNKRISTSGSGGGSGPEDTMD